ncbi:MULTISPECIES: LacI family transcriptional regulator [Rhizobium]|uniref:LacI family transcriptional regulator n=1 Tax=Rhizobium esperanzae TaxID=1967781 RepID=A0A7W6XUY0_9HYPH|nr:MULTISPECIES: LacI family transcriptional regulator [Rhizobium]MBB4439928.1 LacI family transcriptional regulator [Rhizobium esperanzae]MDH6202505.1 LacI family transcriptional regulator [Rhizobium leguminosarum]
MTRNDSKVNGLVETKQTGIRAHRLESRKKPTLKTIATALGLGVTTVSRAIRDDVKIAAATRKAVQDMARELCYHPSRAGLRLRTGKTNVLSLVLDTEEQIGSFLSQIIFGITEGLEGTPYNLIVMPYPKHSDPVAPIRHLVESEAVDGIIISRIQPADPRVRYMIEQGMHFVTHGRTQMGVEHPYVDFDNEAFARISVECLANLGRKRLSLLAPPAGLSFHDHTRHGFEAAMVEHGLEEVPIQGISNDSSIQQIRLAVRKLMQQSPAPDGLISSSGGVSGTGGAILAIQAGLKDVGAIIGRDVDIVTKQLFANLPIFGDEFYVVHEDVRKTGRDLATALVGSIEGKPISELQTLVVPTKVSLQSTTDRDE